MYHCHHVFSGVRVLNKSFNSVINKNTPTPRLIKLYIQNKQIHPFLHLYTFHFLTSQLLDASHASLLKLCQIEVVGKERLMLWISNIPIFRHIPTVAHSANQECIYLQYAALFWINVQAPMQSHLIAIITDCQAYANLNVCVLLQSRLDVILNVGNKHTVIVHFTEEPYHHTVLYLKITNIPVKDA